VLAIFLGAALLAPILVRPVATVLGWPARLRGAQAGWPGRTPAATHAAPPHLGRTDDRSCPGHRGGVITASLEASINQAIDGTVRAQLVVLDEGSGGFSPQVAATLRSDPRLADVSEIRGSDALVGDISTGVTGLDTSNVVRIFSFSMTSGTETSIDATNTTMVDSTEAATENVHVGSVVTMTFPNADEVKMTVGGIYTPDALISGYLVSLTTLNAHLTTVRDQDVAVNAAPGVSLSTADASLLNDLRTYQS